MSERPAHERRGRFGRRQRLRSRRDFDRVYGEGEKVVTRQLVAYLRPLERGPSRLGLSVSRRVGDAPRRNRVKRCLREAFRHLARDLEPALEIVLVARPAAAPRDYAEASRALRAVLRRAGRL